MNYRIEPEKLEFVTDRRFMNIVENMLNCENFEELEKRCDYGKTYVATLYHIDVLSYEEFVNLYDSLFNLKLRLRSDIRRKELNDYEGK